jgi:hypothetical protein
MKYPKQHDIEEMRARGYDPSVIEEQLVLYRRGQVAEAIKDDIRHAFEEVRLGSGVGLWEAQGIDDYADAATCAAFREKDEKNDWSLIPVVELNRCYSSPSFFDAAGMRFHLPAFLIADLSGEHSQGMIFHLTQSSGLESQYDLLDQAQRDAVRNYLAFMAQEPDQVWDREHIQRALAGYWST